MAATGGNENDPIQKYWEMQNPMRAAFPKAYHPFVLMTVLGHASGEVNRRVTLARKSLHANNFTFRPTFRRGSGRRHRGDDVNLLSR